MKKPMPKQIESSKKKWIDPTIRKLPFKKTLGGGSPGTEVISTDPVS